MSAIFTVITLSYNKKDFIGDAISSVLNQTFTDFEYIIVDNSSYFKEETMGNILQYRDSRITLFEESATNRMRKEVAYSALLLNKYYEIASGKYLIFLADDDILMPECLETHYNFHIENPDKKASHHLQNLFTLEKGIYGTLGTNTVFNNNSQPDCVIDGGSVVHEKVCLNVIKKPWYPLEISTQLHCDGIFLNKLADKFDICPINKILSTHRFLPISEFDPRQ